MVLLPASMVRVACLLRMQARATTLEFPAAAPKIQLVAQVAAQAQPKTPTAVLAPVPTQALALEAADWAAVLQQILPLMSAATRLQKLLRLLILTTSAE